MGGQGGGTTCLWSPYSIRLRIAVLIAVALTIEGLMRSNLNMAYVCMVSEQYLEPPRPIINEAREESCPVLTLGVNSSAARHEYKGTLEWTSAQRAYIFPVFYVGGLVATLSTEVLDRKFGSSRAVLYGAVVNVLGTMATPMVAVHFGPVCLAAIRFVMGYGQGVLWPCMSILVARWFPVVEKSTALAIGTTGNQLSVILSMAVTAELCQLDLFGGWPSAFYIYGLFGVVLCVLWWLVVVDFPSECPHLTKEERAHIEGEAFTLVKTELQGQNKKKPKPKWRALMCSPVVWAICGSSFCHNFVVVSFTTYLPFYYKSVHNLSLTSNGILSTLPFIVQFISKVLFAGFADESKKRKWMSVTAATKVCNSAASIGIAISLLVMSFCDCSLRIVAVVSACTAMAFISGYVPGYNTSVVCVAPTQTPAIAGFSRFWAQIGMSLAPTLVGVIVVTGRMEEWRLMYLMMSAMCIVTGVFFQFCGSASVQSWNDDKHNVKSADIEQLITDKETSDKIPASTDMSTNDESPPLSVEKRTTQNV